MSTVTSGSDVADQVRRFGTWLFGELDELGALVGAQLARPAPRRSDLAIEERCARLLTGAATPVAGAGAVLTPHVLADAAYWLEWWTLDPGRPGGKISKLAAETDPRAIGFRDYTELPWYQKPVRTGDRNVTGPYVDYLCTDQYTLTFTQPVVVDGRCVAVVGADVLVAWLEEHLLGVLAATRRPCLLVNARGRVVTSSDPRWVTGDLVRGLSVEQCLAGSEPAHPDWAFSRCGDLPFAVLSARLDRPTHTSWPPTSPTRSA